jgi:hypothetical protein
MIHTETSNHFRDLLNSKTDEEFNKFLNRSLLASGKRCIRVEREGIHGNSTYTMYFSDIVIDTKKETRLYIADVDEKQ